jgi:hypothetical protein
MKQKPGKQHPVAQTDTGNEFKYLWFDCLLYMLMFIISFGYRQLERSREEFSFLTGIAAILALAMFFITIVVGIIKRKGLKYAVMAQRFLLIIILLHWCIMKVWDFLY